MLTLLLSLIATASAGEPAPRTIVLDAAEQPPTDKLRDHIRETIARPYMDWLDGAGLPDTLAESLRLHPSECRPNLSLAEIEDLVAVAAQRDTALYLALPVSPKVGPTLLWRWDESSEALMAVRGRGTREMPVRDVAARVLFLPWPNTQQDGPGRRVLRDMGRPDAEIDADVRSYGMALTEQLLEHPNECVPEVELDMLAALSKEATAGEELYVAVSPPRGRNNYVWRWDAEREELSRVLNVH